MRAPASSSSTSTPQSRRYRVTWSATARSSPGGLGVAASSQNSSRTSAGTRRRLGDFDAAAGARALERGGDELPEERRRPGRPRLELRVELRRDEPRVVGQLDDLDEAPFLERAADDEAAVQQLLAKGVVHLVAVAVALGDHGLAAVPLAGAGAVSELDGLRAEPHRAAEVLDLLLLRQEVDHRMGRLRIHLRRVGAVELADVTRELRDGDV